MTRDALQQVAAVVIGASAGGIDALGILLPGLDSRCRAAILIVVHMPRQRPSLLAGLFRPHCPLPVLMAQDKQPVEEGTVYFAPPDYHLLVDCAEGERPCLALSVDDPVMYSRPSIDVLFESAADCWGSRLMGVVLTGANSDGVDGLGVIARAGGITVAQDPSEALASVLPAAAVRAGVAQQVLPLEGIRELLGRLGRAP